jgi:four helix bundle protein
VVKSFRDLDVWRLGLDLVETIYRCTAGFPKSEIYGLTAQMRRAAVSIPSNIAEGQARSSSKEFLHFLSFALGSLAELETQIELVDRLRYPDTQLEVARAQVELLGKKLHRLQSSIRERTLVHPASHQPLATSY